MICKNCDACKKNWYKNSDEYIEKVDYYTCIGVRHPFTIEDINKECTAYDKEYWKNNIKDRQNKWMLPLSSTMQGISIP